MDTLELSLEPVQEVLGILGTLLLNELEVGIDKDRPEELAQFELKVC